MKTFTLSTLLLASSLLASEAIPFFKRAPTVEIRARQRLSGGGKPTDFDVTLGTLAVKGRRSIASLGILSD